MGRPVSYDREDVLLRAVMLFRVRAFHSLSVQEIVKVTALSRFAIYEKFGSKRELFYACLDFYLEVSVEQDLLGGLQGHEGTFDGLLALLARLRGNNLDPKKPAGCLIVNASVEFGGADARVEQINEAYRAAMRRAIRRALTHAERRGDLVEGRPVEQRTEHLVTMINAFMILRHVSRPAAEDFIVATINEVMTWRRPGPKGAVAGRASVSPRRQPPRREALVQTDGDRDGDQKRESTLPGGRPCPPIEPSTSSNSGLRSAVENPEA